MSVVRTVTEPLSNAIAAPTKAERLLRILEERKGDILHGVSKYEHGLQTATRAYRNNASEEWVVAALLHDVLGAVCPDNHAHAVAELLAPYVSAEVYETLKIHEHLQLDNWAGRPHSEADMRRWPMAIKFVDDWDYPSFDPNYQSMPLDFFRPMVERIIR